MNDVTVYNANQLPATIEELSKFVLIGREKLVAVRAEIRAIDKVGLAQEVRAQKLAEAQDIAEAVLDAEVRIGELMREVPKATTNHKNPDLEIDTGVDFLKKKAQVIKDAGFTQKQAERFQTIAAHPDSVAQAKAEARDNEEIVTRSSVLQKIKAQRKGEIHPEDDKVSNDYTDKPNMEEIKPQVGKRSDLAEIRRIIADQRSAEPAVKTSAMFIQTLQCEIEDMLGRLNTIHEEGLLYAPARIGNMIVSVTKSLKKLKGALQNVEGT